MRQALLTVVALFVGITAFGSEQDTGRTSGIANAKNSSLGIGLAPTPVPMQVLIGKAAVAKELSLSEEQKRRIAKLYKSLADQRAALQKRMSEGRATPEMLDIDVLKQEGDMYAELLRRQEVDGNQALLKLLDVKQRARFGQLHLQAEGPFAFSRAELCTPLNLSPEQFDAIQDVIREGRSQSYNAIIDVARSRAELGIGPDEMARLRDKKVAESRANTLQAIGQVLNKSQRLKYNAMLGERFDFAKVRSGGDDQGSAIAK